MTPPSKLKPSSSKFKPANFQPETWNTILKAWGRPEFLRLLWAATAELDWREAIYGGDRWIWSL